MLSDDTPVYLPQLYRSLGTPVTLNLGSTAHDVLVTRERVEQLPEAVATATAPIAEEVEALDGHVTTQAQRVIDVVSAAHAASLSATAATLKADIRADVRADMAAEVLKVLNKLNALPTPTPVPVPVPVPAPPLITISSRAAPLLALLTQVQTLALDAMPGQPYKGKEPEFKGWTGENVAIHGLRDAAAKEAVVLVTAPQSLQTRFTHAFDEFKGNDLPSRSRRFAEVHALIADVATFLA